MQFKTIPWWVWLVPIAVLLIATERMPYGYYTFTRIVVCGFAAFFAFVGWQEGSVWRVWSVVFGVVTVLFNPIVPVYLRRATWFDIDVGVAIIFAVHLVFMRLRWLQAKRS